MQFVIFLVLASITIIAGVFMVSTDNIARSIFAHVLILLCIAGVYVLLCAEFMAGVQVLIYAGGVSIILLFALMLTKPAKGIIRALDHPWKLPAFITAFCLYGLMLYCVVNTDWPYPNMPSKVISPAMVGKVMFIKYVIPFEIVSVILLVALIGAVVIGSNENNKSSKEKKIR